jgi:6-phosphofructokinase 2
LKIATLTLNPALDKSTSVDRVVPEHKLRCAPLQTDAGGGGINVSKGLRLLDTASTAVLPAGGETGLHLERLLTAAGIDVSIHAVPGETRENFSVMDTGASQQYRFNMPGPELREADADACLQRLRDARPELLVASGSLPPGLPETYYAKVTALARDIGARCIIDTSGRPLQAAAAEGLYLLKPNLAELATLVGAEHLEMNEVDDAALRLIHEGRCEVVVVSLGAQGALLVTRDGFEHVPAPTVKKKTTVGAGDSMVAGMVWALSQQYSLGDMVRFGVACGTAATLNTGTELFDRPEAERLYQWIRSYGERYRFTDF